jgi:hypothetical protein
MSRRGSPSMPLRWPGPQLATNGTGHGAALRFARGLPSGIAGVAGLAVGALVVWNLLVGGRVGRESAIATIAVAILAAAFVAAFARPAAVLAAGWILFVVQQPLGAYVGAQSAHGGTLVGRLDDGVILLVACAVLVRRWVGVAPRPAVTVWVVALLCALLAAGVFSAMRRSDVGPWTLAGAWLGLKLWVTLATCCEIPWRRLDYDRLTKIAVFLGAVVTVFAVIDYVSASTLHTLLHTRFTRNDPNEPARAHFVQSVFESPSRYSNFMTVVFAIMVARYAVDRRGSYLFGACLFGAAGLASLRLRGLLAALAVVCVLLAIVREGRVLRSVQIGGAVVLCVAALGPAAFTGQASRFSNQESGTSRGQLYAGAFELARANFPFGVGFGRYGSYASSLYYSPVYDSLGLSYEFGFSRANPDFVTDAGLSGFIAELGAVGAALFAAGLGVLAWKLASIARGLTNGRGPAAVALSILVAAIVMSLASASLLDSIIVVPLAMFAGMALNFSTRPEG